MSSPARSKRVVIERTWDPEYGDVFMVSDENGEIDASSVLTTALLYAQHAFEESLPEMPADLERVLRDQSVVVPQDQALWERIGQWQNAPSNTASAD